MKDDRGSMSLRNRCQILNGGCILERNWDKDLKNFAPCYSQSPLPADFTPSYSFLGLEISTATADREWSLTLFKTSNYLFVHFSVPFFFLI